MFGRRRVGKTALIRKFGEGRDLLYSQAIEGSPSMQIEQLCADLQPAISAEFKPKNWREFFSLLSLSKASRTIVIDEFPYLVRSDASLASILQNWVDHDQPERLQLILLGSSQTMMHSIFLSSKSPLYDRADLIVKVKPMSFKHYLESNGAKKEFIDEFLKFSMMGGIPRYWKYVDRDADVMEVADALFFGRSARLEDEPDRILRDEDVGGQQAKAVLESLGRGSVKPTEIAGRMGIPQTALSKPLRILMDANLVTRTIPFGESPRNSKRTWYKIEDYALRFWYQVYSPHRSRWHHYSRSEKINLIRIHAGSVLEDEYRKLFPEACPYWEGEHFEMDCLRFANGDPRSVIVTELKLGKMRTNERQILEEKNRENFTKSQLSQRYRLAGIEILDAEDALKKILKA